MVNYAVFLVGAYFNMYKEVEVKPVKNGNHAAYEEGKVEECNGKG